MLRRIDLHQVVGDHRLDRLAGQHDRHPIPKAGQPDRPALIHRALHTGVAQIRPIVWGPFLCAATAAMGSTTAGSGPAGASANRSAGGRMPSD